VPADWIRAGFTPHSRYAEGRGYGYLWWIYEAGSLGEDYPTLDRGPVYLARGSGGQALFVLPDENLVVAHLSDGDNGREVSGAVIWRIVERIAAAASGTPVERPAYGEVRAEAFASGLPAAARPEPLALGPAERAEFAGSYAMEEGGDIRVFEFEERLFLAVPGLGEAEILTEDGDAFYIREDTNVSITFGRDDAGAVARVVVRAGEQTVSGERT
jgi:hypothetical protein